MTDRKDVHVDFVIRRSLAERIEEVRVRWGDSKRVFFAEAMAEHLRRLESMEAMENDCA